VPQQSTRSISTHSLAKLLVEDFFAHEPPVKTEPVLDGLTSREQEVLGHLAEGATNEEIAEILGISPKTVARHRENLMRKLNLHSGQSWLSTLSARGLSRLNRTSLEYNHAIHTGDAAGFSGSIPVLYLFPLCGFLYPCAYPTLYFPA
jgi:DNA-binding NarL/FixJ family response regulator